MVEILASIFKDFGEDEIGEVCYLVLGQIGPGYEDVNLGLSEKTVQSAIADASGYNKSQVEEEILNLGDIGEVASKILKSSEKKFKRLFDVQKEPSVNDIYHGFRKIALASGKGSQKVKTETLASMLLDADDMGRKYIASTAPPHWKLK